MMDMPKNTMASENETLLLPETIAWAVIVFLQNARKKFGI
jgi:hypothetical protein